MRNLIVICVLAVVMGGSKAHAGGILRIFGGAGTGDFYRGGGGASFGFDIPVSDERLVYLGTHFTFHNGTENRTLPDALSGGSAEIGDVSQSQIGAEIGLSLGSFPWVIRPTVGGGVARITLGSVTAVLTPAKRSVVYVGTTVGRMVTETAMVGIEVRAIRVSDLGNAVAGYLTLGTTFGE